MQHTKTIITVASWEDRFIKGMVKTIDAVCPERIMMYHYDKYDQWSGRNRQKLEGICKKKSIELIDIKLLFDLPLDSWKSIVKNIKTILRKDKMVTLDITTMPRETIWSICAILFDKKIPIQYIYHKPQRYAKWLSRDPGRPRIIYRLGGIQTLGQKTILFIQTGYDVERTKQLVKYFEPDRVVLGLQTGKQLQNAKKNREIHIAEFLPYRNIELFDVDGYSLENTVKAFSEKIDPYYGKYNIIISSLGPKVGSLALFAIKNIYPDIAMCYAPSKEFNLKYSEGLGLNITGIIQ